MFMRSSYERTRAYLRWLKDDIRRFAIASVVGTVSSIAFLGFYFMLAPQNFPVGQIVTIPEGATLSEVSGLFDENAIVASPFFLKLFVALFAGDAKIQAGDYYFDRPLTVQQVAKKITTGDYGIKPIKITIPEGATIEDMSIILAKRMPEFDTARFFELTKGKEGYLFPDTYFFLPTATEEEIVQDLSDTFEERFATIEDLVEESGRTREEIVTMASIIEKEAWKEKDRRMISGVLWNRIDIGMPLQVDATFLYINGKSTYDLTKADLRIDSPYNTYRNKELPPGPICSPSLSSLEAAVSPEDSAYLFYLADREGNTYYSLDFEEHKRYKQLHL